MKVYIVKPLLVWTVTVSLLSACGSDAKKVKENDIRFDTIAVKESYHMKKIETNPGSFIANKLPVSGRISKSACSESRTTAVY